MTGYLEKKYESAGDYLSIPLVSKEVRWLYFSGDSSVGFTGEPLLVEVEENCDW